MTAFYFNSGVGASPCAEVPESGLLIQTPGDAGRVEFYVNEVTVQLDSTAFIQAIDNVLGFYLLEGSAIITADGETVFLPAGTFTTVPLTEGGRSPASPPTSPAPYDTQILSGLTSLIQRSGVPEVIEIAQPLAEEDIDAAIRAIFAPNGLLEGWYRVNLVSFTENRPTQYTDGYCASGGNMLAWVRIEGDDIGNVIPVSLTEFILRTQYADDFADCEGVHRGVWTNESP